MHISLMIKHLSGDTVVCLRHENSSTRDFLGEDMKNVRLGLYLYNISCRDAVIRDIMGSNLHKWNMTALTKDS